MDGRHLWLIAQLSSAFKLREGVVTNTLSCVPGKRAERWAGLGRRARASPALFDCAHGPPSPCARLCSPRAPVSGGLEACSGGWGARRGAGEVLGVRLNPRRPRDNYLDVLEEFWLPTGPRKLVFFYQVRAGADARGAWGGPRPPGR